MTPQQFINQYNKLFPYYTFITRNASGHYWVYQDEPYIERNQWRSKGYKQHLIKPNITSDSTNYRETLRKATK